MKIFVSSRVYPNLNDDTNGLFVHELNKELSMRGYKIVVLDVQEVGRKNWNIYKFNEIKRYTLDKIEVFHSYYRAFIASKLPYLNRISFSFKFKKVYQEAVKFHGEPDLVITHFTLFSGYNAMLNFKKTIPVLVIEHHSRFLNDTITRYEKKALNTTVSNSNSFIAVSNLLKKKINQHITITKEINVVPNMVSSEYSYMPPVKKKNFIFLHVGSLIPSKNQVNLIYAFIQSFTISEQVELRIVGKGECFNQLKKIILEHEREHQIKLLGPLPPVKLKKQYSESDAFVSFSKFETFGIVYRESMMVGRPIISTRNGGIEEDWDDKLGILTESFELSNLSKCLVQMYKNYDKYNLKSISDHAASHYSSKVVVDQIERLIKEILVK